MSSRESSERRSIPKDAEADLGLDPEVAELIVATTSEGIWLIDTDNRTVFVNQHTARMLGYDVAEMRGAPLFSFMDDDGRMLAELKLARRREGIEERYEFKFRRKDGTELWAELGTNPVHDRDGDYAGSLAMMVDITERKRAEQVREQHTRDLEQLIALRTAALEAANRELEAVNARLREEATRDGLTGLHNSRYFRERFDEEVSRARRHKLPLGLIFIDIDHFKTINDTFGHLAGDAVMAQLGRMLGRDGVERGLVRRTDVVARYGGDEIVVIVPHTPRAGIRIVAERILQCVTANSIPVPDNQAISVTASIGFAAYPDDGSDAEAIIQRADRALYAAKAGGRNRVSDPPLAN